MSTRNFCGSGNIGVVAYSENKQRKIKNEIRRDCTKMCTDPKKLDLKI